MNGAVLDILVVVAFVLVGGAFAAAEIALVSLRSGQVERLKERGRRGRRVASLVEDPNRYLAAVQIGVTLAGFFSAAFGAATLAEPMGDVLEDAGLPHGLSKSLAFILITVVISYLSLVVGELVPKRLGLQRPERFALAVAGPLDRIAALFRPVIWLLSRSTNALVRLLGGDPQAGGDAVTEEELRGMVSAHESLSRDERKLIDDVFTASDRQISEVMRPRTEVDFLEATATVSRALRSALETRHSRYPVIGRSTDDIIGFVHVWDLVDVRRGSDRSVTVGDIVREVVQLPGSKKVLAALAEMRRGGQQMAIVVDEYGGTDGIVTLEDLIEEVIGDIRDEYDEPGEGHLELETGEVELDGLTNLDEFAEATGVRLPDGPYETVAGYVMSMLRRLPEVGDVIEVGGRAIAVVNMDGRRIARLRVSPQIVGHLGANGTSSGGTGTTGGAGQGPEPNRAERRLPTG